ncbi:flavin monoamine oxidase family protein [Streptomyces sp. NPDC001828]|uniref:flavin monoamine oxidase family protein n=1 Tax=Streptomyces sp. NPDC001828 TaxID=3364615 RepID=UPI00369F98AB
MRRARQDHADVVVIGAGVAGLTAALALQDAGADVLVVEAAPLAGGRIRTHRFPEPHRHATGELGAMRVLEEHDRTRRLLERVGLTGRLTPYAPMFHDTHSLLATADSVRGAEEALTARPGTRSGATTLQVILDGVTPWPVARRTHRHDRLPTLPALTTTGSLPTRLVEYLATCADRLDGSDPVLATALRELALEFKPALACPEGLDLLPKCLAALLERPVRHLHRLVSLTEGRDHVEAQCESGSPPRLLRIRAAVAVCALPVWLLPRIHLEGPVRSLLHKDIAGRAPSGARKMLVHMARPVWQDQGIRSGGSAGGPLLRQVFYPCGTPDGDCDCAVLTVYATGRDTAAMGRIPPTQRLDVVVRQLARLHPAAGQPGMVLGHAVADWSQVPFVHGAFDGEWRPATNPLDRHGIRTGRVLLAGDSLSRRPGWVEGAVSAGERAAEDANVALRSRARPPHTPLPSTATLTKEC